MTCFLRIISYDELNASTVAPRPHGLHPSTCPQLLPATVAGFFKQHEKKSAKEVPSAPFTCQIMGEETDLEASNYFLNHFKTAK
ncbi:MAG: hypothetical protein CRN43_00500 [Candidatus Nephrothrix sp. EaCA]|nr:MAG: hypothetical protein CRN43_00500 [Candidatus Nephrothrix sp. EaCA]